jgi:hypothetical protein
VAESMDVSGTEASDADTDTADARLRVLQLPERPSSARSLRSLPEDDGNRVLRKRIFSIQSRSIPSTEKARLMHHLLSEGYTKSQLLASSRHDSIDIAAAARLSASPGSPTSHVPPSERHGLSGRLQSFKETWYPSLPSLGSPGDTAAVLDLPLTEEDLRPTFVPRKPREDGDLMEEEDDECDAEAAQRFGCKHYVRNVKMQCAMCEKWYTCRLCHDEAETHTLPRRETQHMLCMFCGCAQGVSDTCIKCAKTAAHYYCAICKLWSDDPDKPVYHCYDCGLCRVGRGLGKDYFHCQVSAKVSRSSFVHVSDANVRRNAMPAWISKSPTLTNVLNARRTATAPSAEITYFRRSARSAS